MRHSAYTFLLMVSLLGCAISNRQHADHPTSANWTKENFRVHFQAGPRGREDRSYSFYEIKHTGEDQQERSLVMESAHSLGGFQSVTNGDPKNWIRIIEDPSGHALLIEEEIPNDAGPCSNYLWVRSDSNGFLEGTYLRLPSKTTGSHGGINYEYPKVRALDGENLTYTYSQGEPTIENIDSIEKVDRPTPPG